MSRTTTTKTPGSSCYSRSPVPRFHGADDRGFSGRHNDQWNISMAYIFLSEIAGDMTPMASSESTDRRHVATADCVYEARSCVCVCVDRP